MCSVLSFSKKVPSQYPAGHAWGCANISKGLPFCNPEYSFETRIDDLIQRLTISEKLGLLSPYTETGHVNSCAMLDAGVLRLGIPRYMHLVETNTAVASTCLSEGVCATEWPGPGGLAATFNRTLWKLKGNIMAEEMRALNNLNWVRSSSNDSFIGLHGFGPNINLVRDPRWGRNSECPSEDPFLAGSYAVEYVKGAQRPDGDGSKYMKMTLGLKHYTAYSMEANRMSFIPNITKLDLWDSFLPSFRMAFMEGRAAGAMCSYAGLNGVPSCANDYLLNQVVRDHFGRPDAVMGTDCTALSNLVNENGYADSKVDAAAKALNGGTDLELGDSYWSPQPDGGLGLLGEALLEGRVTQERINLGLHRVLLQRFATGQFDPLEQQPYTRIGAEAVNSSRAQQLTLEAALQSLVLLTNPRGVLPLKGGQRLAVLGPMVWAQEDLFSDYHGDRICYGGGYDCVPTLGATFSRLNGNWTGVAQGVPISGLNASGMDAALEAARRADQVVLCLGTGYSVEHEGIDRDTTSLPGLQSALAVKVLKLGKPTVIVLINGGIVSIDELLPFAPAVVEAFYPSMRGAEALFSALFGHSNRWGKMPVTMYNSSFSTDFEMSNFEMSKPPGRTYKWFTGEPLFPFGAGLSYTTFNVSAVWNGNSVFSPSSGPLQVICSVQNTGWREGDEVVQLYHTVGDSIRNRAGHPVPLRALVAFERVADVAPLATRLVFFAVDKEQLVVTDADGHSVLYSGDHQLLVSNGAGSESLLVVTVEGGDETTVQVP